MQPLSRPRSGRLPTVVVLPLALAAAAGAPASAFAGEALTYLAASVYQGTSRVCVDDTVPPAFCDTIATSARSVAIGDVDSDGYRDVVLARTGDNKAQLCLNNGLGIFTCASIVTAAPGLSRLGLADFNRDGRLDVVLGNNLGPTGPRVQVCFNVNGTFFACGHLDDLISFEPMGLAVGDIDNDGAPDLLLTRFDGPPPKACLNDGQGLFVSCLDLPDAVPGAETGSRPALSDLDGDGNLDAVLPTRANLFIPPDQVCLGNGAGLFSCRDVGRIENDTTDAVAVGDVDGDGHLDLVFAGLGSKFCPGDGSGSFPICFDLGPVVGTTGNVALADLDGDGRAEIAFAKGGVEAPNRLCRFLGYAPGGEPQLDCLLLDPIIEATGWDVALWTPWIFQDGFESGDTARWSTTVE